MHIHARVDLCRLLREVNSVHLPIVILDALGLPLEVLHNGLCFASVTSARLLGTLHQRILLHELSIGNIRQFFSFVRHLELLGDHAEHLRTI